MFYPSSGEADEPRTDRNDRVQASPINRAAQVRAMSPKPKYLLDQMFNGLVDDLRDAGYDCNTATRMILKNNDSRVSIEDERIVQFLQREGVGYTLVTADLRFVKRCRSLGINCIEVNQKELVVSHLKSRM